MLVFRLENMTFTEHRIDTHSPISVPPFEMGAFLQRTGNDERSVEYISRLLLPVEVNYSAMERKALGVLWAKNHFRSYIEWLPVSSKVTIC